jgi:carboxymethylenebutenolidase
MVTAAMIFTGLVRSQDTIPDSHSAAGGKPVGRMITLSDFGAEDLAYLAVPTSPPTVGLVLVPDAYGLDDFTKAEADRLASLGYIVLAIDIYNGHLTTDPGDLANMTANLSADSAMKTLNAGIRLFHESPKFHTDHVIAMGWGVGATYVFQTARDSKTLDGAITFYGPVLTDAAQVRKFTVPLCAVYPEVDSIATKDNVTTFQHLMHDSGNDFNAWFIAAQRGWADPKSKTYNPGEDKEAWKVAMPFVIRIGGLPVKPKDNSIIDKAKDKIESMFK